MTYDIIELRGLALGIISDYTEVPQSELRNDQSLWDDLTIEDHDITNITLDILDKTESSLDINSDYLIPLLESDTIKEFLHALYAIEF